MIAFYRQIVRKLDALQHAVDQGREINDTAANVIETVAGLKDVFDLRRVFEKKFISYPFNLNRNLLSWVVALP